MNHHSLGVDDNLCRFICILGDKDLLVWSKVPSQPLGLNVFGLHAWLENFPEGRVILQRSKNCLLRVSKESTKMAGRVGNLIDVSAVNAFNHFLMKRKVMVISLADVVRLLFLHWAREIKR